MKRVYLHYHLPNKRVITHDLSPPTLEDQYRDLAKRLQAALAVQGHSTDPSLRIAAGVAIYDLSGAVLLLKRRPDCEDHPGEWAFPAGGIDPGETPEQCARREAWEETGRRPLILKPLGIYEEPGVCFHGFKEMVVGRFNPRLCREHTEFKWSTPDDRPRPLHPGVAKMLRLAKAPTKDDANPQDPEGKWITLNGAHVFINKKGEITKGPPHLVGKHKDDVGGKDADKLEPKAKGVKNVVHELLSTGHEWHFDELKTATGAKLDQQLHNALNELKAGKGALGQLSIKKTGPKHYQVVGPDGKPVAGLPSAESAAAEATKVIEQAKKPQEAVAAPTPPQPPAPEPVVAPSPVSAPPSPAPDTTHGFVAKPPATKMSTADADAAYAKDLADVNGQAQATMSMLTGDPDDMDGVDPVKFVHDTAYEWKIGKAQAMAQWAANVKGVEIAAKPVEVFEEDKNLMHALAEAGSDAETAKAISDWKAATAKAKYAPKVSPEQAAVPKSDTYLADVPPAPAKPAAPPPPPVDVSKITHALEAPKALVPGDHDHISPEHFSNGEYQKEIAKAHKLLHGSNEGAVQNKIRIQKALDAKLANSPHFKDIEAQYLKTHPNAAAGKSSLAARLISQWASSSGNHHPVSVASQLAIADAFNMAPEHVETKAFHLLHGDAKGDHDTVYKMAATELGIKSNTPESMAKFKAGLRDFALAQYHATQDHLASLGIKELHLIRGMKFGGSQEGAKPVDIKLQPASSFTTNHSTAVGFAGSGSLFMVKVPASQVMSSFITGYGCTSESEVVVLNHPGMKAIQIGAGKGTDTSTLIKNVNASLANGANSVGETGWAYDPDAKKDAPKKKAGSFTPTHLPPIPVGVGKKSGPAMLKAAKAGDIEAVKAIHAGLGMSMPNTKKYGDHLLAELNVQHKAHLEAQAIKAATTPKPGSTAKPVATTAEGVKKNAHYYKKLKEKVLTHPHHGDAIYTGLKNSGMTNEQILDTYNKAHKAMFGAEA